MADASERGKAMFVVEGTIHKLHDYINGGEDFEYVTFSGRRRDELQEYEEQTCRNEETAMPETFFKCSECGAYAYSFFRHKDGTSDKLHYCPNCRRKVVE